MNTCNYILNAILIFNRYEITPLVAVRVFCRFGHRIRVTVLAAVAAGPAAVAGPAAAAVGMGIVIGGMVGTVAGSVVVVAVEVDVVVVARCGHTRKYSHASTCHSNKHNTHPADSAEQIAPQVVPCLQTVKGL